MGDAAHWARALLVLSAALATAALNSGASQRGPAADLAEFSAGYGETVLDLPLQPKSNEEALSDPLPHASRAGRVSRLSSGKDGTHRTSEDQAAAELNKGANSKDLLDKAEKALNRGDAAKAKAFLDAAKKANRSALELKRDAKPRHLFDILQGLESAKKGAAKHGEVQQKAKHDHAPAAMQDTEFLLQLGGSDNTLRPAPLLHHPSFDGTGSVSTLSGAASALSGEDADLGEVLHAADEDIETSPFPTHLHNFAHPAKPTRDRRPIHHAAPTHSRASTAEEAAESVGFAPTSGPQHSAVPKEHPGYVRHGTKRPASHFADTPDDSTAPSMHDRDAGPAELGASEEGDHSDLGEAASVEVDRDSLLAARIKLLEARVASERAKRRVVAAPCSGHGEYEIRAGGTGNMDVACRCQPGWTGPDCKTGCPSGTNHKECTGNGVCQFQAFPMPAAQCKCSNMWKGDVCDTCSLNTRCANGAIPDPKCSKCECSNKWSGLHCSTCGLKCAHGGTPDDDCSNCKCTHSWKGDSCQTCGFAGKCLHGKVKSDCSGCTCSGNWVGKYCDKCGVYCANGVPNRDCTGCVCQNEWAGEKCDKCQMVGACRNGAVPSSSCDSCDCPKDAFWQGSFCHVCGLVCINGKAEGDCKRCRCEGNWAGKRCDKCKMACTYGTSNPMCDKCLCPGGWSGPLCTTCDLKCSTGYQRDSTCSQCIRKLSEKHSLAFNGDLDVAEMKNPLKPRGDLVATIEFRLKTLRDKGVQGLLCSRQHFKGSLCIYLHDDRIALTVFGNRVTSSKSLVSSPTQIFDYRLRPYTGYAIAVVYSPLENGMGYAKLYVNGKLHGTKFYALGNPAIMSEMLVGGVEGHQNTFFQGFLDDIRLWSEPRTPRQIKHNYNKPMLGVEQGLLAYFPFDRPGEVQHSEGVAKWEVNVHDVVFSDEFVYGHTKFQEAPMD